VRASINVSLLSLSPGHDGSLVSEESCKAVGARILNMILGQHPKVSTRRLLWLALIGTFTTTVDRLLAALCRQVSEKALPVHPIARGAIGALAQRHEHVRRVNI
jgi:hypothetical protein